MSPSATSGKRSRLFLALLLVVGVVFPVVWLAGYDTEWFGAPDACDYAQMGRQIHDGHGMSTLQILPRHVRYFHDRQVLQAEEWPNLYRYPLPTVANAAFQLVREDPAEAAVLQTGVWTWLLIVAVFFLAARLTDPLTGAVAALLVATDPLLWKLSFSGMTEPMACLLVAGVAYWSFADPSHGLRRAALLGGLCALALLNRTQLLILLPWAVAGYLWSAMQGPHPLRVPGRRELAQTGAIVLVFLLVLSPWALRNWQITGSPTFSFSTTRNLFTGVVEGNLDLQLDAPWSLSELAGRYGSEIPAKLLDNLWPNALSWDFWWTRLGKYLLALPLALGAILLWDRRTVPSQKYKAFRVAGLGLWLGVFLVASLAFHRPRFYVPLIPILAVVLARELTALASMLLGRLELRREGARLLSTCLVCILVLGANASGSLSVTDPRLYGVPDPTLRQEMEQLRQAIEPGRIVAAEDSGQVALFARTRALRMPETAQDLLTIDRDYLPVDYVLLESGPGRAGPRRRRGSTAALLQSAEFRRRYRLALTLRGGAELYERRRQPGPD